ncbi:hypothetical protein [Halarcobacter sp.]|uniref:hypothetical protein n=1 Tax=Halarcobacter sp. TaxID=2321133 RepID=UPI002AA8B18D|nr:hypothetical protein [Halarcobacter sp.]
MNKINPIYILAFVVVVFLISISILNNKENEFKNLNKYVIDLNTKGKIFSEYKNNWFNKTAIINKVDRIIKNTAYKNEKILKTQTNSLVRIKFESNNTKLLNSFLNRVLNEKFLLKKIDIEKTSIYLEIGLI